MGPYSIAAAVALATSAFARPALASVGARTPDAAAPGVDALLSRRSLQETCAVGDVNLCLSIDESGSVCGGDRVEGRCSSLPCCERFQNQIDFSTNLTANLGEEFASSEHSLGISIVTFASIARIDLEVTTDYNAAISELNQIYYSGGLTNHRDAIAFCQDTFPGPEAGDESPPKNVILLLTDGTPSIGKAGTDAATAAKIAGSIIIPVFISPTSNSDTLDYMRGLSNDNSFYQVADFDELQTLLGQINHQICQASPTSSPTSPPTLTPTTSPTQAPTKNPTSPPTTSNPTSSPSSPPTLMPTSNPTSPPTSNPTSNPTSSPSSPPTSTPTSNPTQAPTKGECLGGDVNLCLSIDESGSICDTWEDPRTCSGDTNTTCCAKFENEIEFSENLIVNLGEQFARNKLSLGISIVTFSHEATIDLNMTTDYNAVINPLRQIYYSAGGTNHRDAIAFCQNTFPEPEAGDESPPKNVILLLTDGEYSRKKYTGRRSAAEAKNEGTIILPVFVSTTTDNEILGYMRGLSNDNTIYQVGDFAELEDLIGKINHQICATSPPTSTPTKNPTRAPAEPTPTSSPTSRQPQSPTSSPTSHPTSPPTLFPTFYPTEGWTWSPTWYPTSEDWTYSPTWYPTTYMPTEGSTTTPPTSNPMSTSMPTSNPSRAPTNNPTNAPTSPPTSGPAISATSSPTLVPTSSPTQAPTNNPMDINECLQSELNDCDSNAQCANTLGSYTCTCTTGWEGDGTSCTNINECDQGTHDCDENALCTDTDGSWECACPEGWIGNGISCETHAPSLSPSKKPTTTPTISPSSLPSLQPSIVEQFITIVGRLSVNRDICSFSPQQLDAYIRSALAAVQEVIGCIDEELCTARITNNVCGKYPVSQSSSRMLQTGPWQLDYEITESFTCEYASCNSAGDSATTQSVIAGTKIPIESSLSSDQFLAILSQNIIKTGEFDAAMVTCFAVWGIVEEPELAVAPAEEDEIGLFYPDWDDHSGTCLRGDPPLYMELNPEGWLFDTLESCCARYYGGWNYNKCMNIQGSGLWYVSHLNELCVTDCEEGQGKTCGGLANPFSDDLYADPRSCCVADLHWRFVEFCESESLLGNCYAGTGLYYRGDNAGSKVCVRDCDPSASGDTTCGGLVEDTYIVLYDSAEECCSAQYGWMTNELCAARSDQVDINKYWPDKTNSKCILDSHDPAEDLSISIYNSTAECCEKGVHWLSEVECLTASGDSASLVASYMFFVDWEKERCVQDCEGAAPCVGLGKLNAWDDAHDTSQQCCDEIGWIRREDCVLDAAT